MKWREINKINQPYNYGMKKVEQGDIFALIDIVNKLKLMTKIMGYAILFTDTNKLTLC
jgi:hypothetical protein